MAGIEQNPGPKEVFVFRYQYLLIEVGTILLRKLFDSIVGNDFMRYLNANPTQYKQLQYLRNKDIINDVQKKLFPPDDMKPTSSNFDITLLALLLRNVCGLLDRKDPVWITPAPGDLSVEAEITRLRLCRNNLMHSDTVVLLKTDFEDKWKELNGILTRLNKTSGITDLSILIDNAREMDIDDELTDRLDKTLKAWDAMDQDLMAKLDRMDKRCADGHDRVVKRIKTVEQGVATVQQEVTTVQRGLSTVHHEVKQGLTSVQQELTIEQQRLSTVQQEVKEGLSTVQQEVKQGLTSVQQEVAIVQQGLSTVQQEVKEGLTSIQKEVTTVQQGLSTVQQEVKQGLSTVQQEVKQELTSVQQEVITVQQEVKLGLTSVHQEVTTLQQEVKLGLTTVQEDMKILKSFPTEDAKDLKTRLMKMYQEDCSTLPVLPLCDDDEYGVDLLSFYKPPSLFHVPYHRTEEKEEQYRISSYKEIFSKGDHSFCNVFITGDAGVGKSSLCKCMSLLWKKSQCNEKVEDEVTQKNIEFMAKFDFAFFVSLRDTDRNDVISMIVEQIYTEIECDSKMKELCKLVENTLNEHVCLVILDGLDEWSPKTSRRKKCALPDKRTVEKSSFLITCRPYKIETDRLSHRDLDRQVQIRGICGKSTKRYVEEIVARCNKANGENRSPKDFVREVKKCELYNQLCIPVVGSHLVAIWFDSKLTDMSRALIYSNILEMLFERAEKRGIHSPSAPLCSVQLPDSHEDLIYLKNHFSLLEKICLLSFRSLFKLDKYVLVYVCTRKQLMSEPYFFSDEEIVFLCKIGILSRNKVIGQFGKQEQKLSFLHKSYLEYFAALFVSSFDSSNAFDNVVKVWTTLNDILQYQNFFIFLIGFSCEKVNFLIEDIYLRISDDLTRCRRNAIFHNNDSDAYTKQIQSLQSMVINCFKQVSRSRNPNFSLKLEDFIFDYDDSQDDPAYIYISDSDSSESLSDDDEYYTDRSLKQLLLLNRTCVHYLRSCRGRYFVEIDQIENLEILHVGVMWSFDVCAEDFTECMLQNQSSLNTLCIESVNGNLIPEIPVRNLKHLTSLSVAGVKIHHYDLHNLVTFLSDNVLIENVKLSSVYCNNHQQFDSDCTLTLNLPLHRKLTLLCLYDVNIICYKVNHYSLKSLKLLIAFGSIVKYYIDVLNCMKYSQLEHLHINGYNRYRYNEMKALTCAVETLSNIKSLELQNMELPDGVLLQLHQDVTQVKIDFWVVKMSRECFHCFMKSFVNNKSVIKVELIGCKISSADGETQSVLSEEESVDYMSEYLTSIPSVNITSHGGKWLDFETGNSQ